jgi:hypothetical protein
MTFPRSLFNLGAGYEHNGIEDSMRRCSLFIVLDGELEMTRYYTRLFVIAGGVTRQFEDLRGEVLQNGSEVNGCTSTDTLGVVALLQETMDTADGELDWGTKSSA